MGSGWEGENKEQRTSANWPIWAPYLNTRFWDWAMTMDFVTLWSLPCCGVCWAPGAFEWKLGCYISQDTHLTEHMGEHTPICFLFQAPDHISITPLHRVSSVAWKAPDDSHTSTSEWEDSESLDILLLASLAHHHRGEHIASACIPQEARLRKTKVKLTVCSHRQQCAEDLQPYLETGLDNMRDPGILDPRHFFSPRHFYTIYAIFTRFTRFLHDFMWFLHNFTRFLRFLHDFTRFLRNFTWFLHDLTRFLRFSRYFLPGKKFSIPGTKNYYAGLAWKDFNLMYCKEKKRGDKGQVLRIKKTQRAPEMYTGISVRKGVPFQSFPKYRHCLN